tara:strand:- start:1434 stop:2987 length:1554 start_codon:yes stop_codon:yes gene_type:complete
VSPSLFNLEKLNEIRYWSKPIQLEGWTVVNFIGDDSLGWLERQLSQKVKDLPASGKAVARLDRVARIKYYGVLWADQTETLNLLIPTPLVKNLEEDLEKFVIMEDIKIQYKLDQKWSFVFGPSDQGQAINFFNEEGHLVPTTEYDNNIDCNQLFALCAIPRNGKDITGTELINETRLNELAVDYKKGCFLGQETAAKIETRRGANLYPSVLEIEGKAELGKFFENDKNAGEIIDLFNTGTDQYLAIAKLKRDYRVLASVHNFSQEIGSFHATVSAVPYFKDCTNTAKALTLYHAAVKYFEASNSDRALDYLVRSTQFDPSFADAYEVMGVIYARQNKHELAIEWMDKLLEVNPKSVMAHTNKSLALMKLGKIEEAEEEKALATVKSFSMFGDEAKAKKQIEAEKNKKAEEMNRRESMFTQVLAIDENDLIALYGLSDIHFQRNNYETSLDLVNKALVSNPKHSQSILLKGKLLELLGKIDDAIDVFKHGVKVASAQGELMPANEMQSKLNQLLNLKS